MSIFIKPRTEKDRKQAQLIQQGGAVTGYSTQAGSKCLGNVTFYDNVHNSYNVIVSGGAGSQGKGSGATYKDIPRKTDNVGAESPLPIGTTVVVELGLGIPYIDGVLPFSTSKDIVNTAYNYNGPIGGTDVEIVDTLSTNKPYFKQPGIPANIVSGDHILVSESGNSVGALNGGISFLDGGPNGRAKIEVLGDQGVVHSTCENFKLDSSWGTVEMVNEEGKTSFKMRGGSNRGTETLGKHELWTFKLDIGNSGDYFNMEITDIEGNVKAKYNISPEGAVTEQVSKGKKILNSGDSPYVIDSNGSIIEKTLKNINRFIEGSIKEQVNGNKVSDVGGNSVLLTGGGYSQVTGGDASLHTMGTKNEVIKGGSALTAKPGDIAGSLDVLNGSYRVNIGDPKNLANPLAKAGYSVMVNNGNVVLGQGHRLTDTPSLHTTVSLNTSLPGSVALGGTAFMLSKNPALFHGVLYEPLRALLVAMALQFDTHVHAGPPLPVAVPMSPMVNGMTNTIKSLRVKIGG